MHVALIIASLLKAKNTDVTGEVCQKSCGFYAAKDFYCEKEDLTSSAVKTYDGTCTLYWSCTTILYTGSSLWLGFQESMHGVLFLKQTL